MAKVENQILNAICEYLSLYERQGRMMYWRNNNAPIYDTNIQGFRRPPKHSKKGVPDIIVIYKGQFIGIEVKTKTGAVSQDQIEFKRMVEENGGRYIVMRSASEVTEIFRT